MSEYLLDSKQAASASQFDRQSDRCGKSHILADTQDVAMGLAGVVAPKDGMALDVATGGGHTALWLARQGWKVTAGDIAPRMLENAQKLCADAGLRIETRLFPAEQMPFADCTFDLVLSEWSLITSVPRRNLCRRRHGGTTPAPADHIPTQTTARHRERERCPSKPCCN